MSDLIWIGNTLFPRWLGFACVGLAILGAFVLARAILSLLSGQGGGK